jgi:D-methionine transport system ATP-binding protein
VLAYLHERGIGAKRSVPAAAQDPDTAGPSLPAAVLATGEQGGNS